MPEPTIHANTHYLFARTQTQREIDHRIKAAHAPKVCACGKPATRVEGKKCWCSRCWKDKRPAELG